MAGGTPPYTYTWYLNGKPVANTTTPEYSYYLNTGQNYLQVKAIDSLGYSVMSKPIALNTSYNYTLIGGITGIAAAAALAILALRRRR
jgi:hypothetical protein